MKLIEIHKASSVEIKNLDRNWIIDFDKKIFTDKNGKEYPCKLPLHSLKYLLPHVDVIACK